LRVPRPLYFRRPSPVASELSLGPRLFRLLVCASRSSTLSSCPFHSRFPFSFLPPLVLSSAHAHFLCPLHLPLLTHLPASLPLRSPTPHRSPLLPHTGLPSPPSASTIHPYTLSPPFTLSNRPLFLSLPPFPTLFTSSQLSPTLQPSPPQTSTPPRLNAPIPYPLPHTPPPVPTSHYSTPPPPHLPPPSGASHSPLQLQPTTTLNSTPNLNQPKTSYVGLRALHLHCTSLASH